MTKRKEFVYMKKLTTFPKIEVVGYIVENLQDPKNFESYPIFKILI